MDYTYEQLNDMTVAQLREIAQGIDHEAVHGFSTMHKEKLLPAVCTALGIEAHTHHHVKEGVNKGALKAQIRALKRKRDEAISQHDNEGHRAAQKEIHKLKRRLRKSIV